MSGGGGLKVGGHINFHVASRGSLITLASQQGVSCNNCSKFFFPRSLRSLGFYKLTLIRPFSFSVCKSYSVSVVLLL